MLIRRSDLSIRYQGMRLVTLVLVSAAVALAGCVTGDPRLRESLGATLQTRAASGATYVARVIDLESGRELYAHDSDRPVMPASNMKLVVTAAGLDLLGPDHVFRTYLAADGDNLWILGTGDPSLGDHNLSGLRGEPITAIFDQWHNALTEHGITSVSGDLVYWDGAFESQQLHPSWEHDDLVHWYAAPVSGLNFNDNCLDIEVRPSQDAMPASYDVTPPVTGYTFINQCITGAPAAPSIDRMAYSDVYVLGGGCSKATGLKSKPVGSPGAFLADAFRTHLAARGFEIEGATTGSPIALDDAMPPESAKVIAVYETPIADVLQRINQNSQNLFAECLHKYTGAAYSASKGQAAPGSWADGERAVRDFLRRQHVDDRGFSGQDGSGLSRQNRVTARLMTDVLAAMHTHRYAESYRASMATAGMGELRRRMNDLDGHLWAKTGYIRGVRALSGYVKTRSGRWLAFSFIFNDIPTQVAPFNDLQDAAVRALYEWPDAQELDAPDGVNMNKGEAIAGN